MKNQDLYGGVTTSSFSSDFVELGHLRSVITSLENMEIKLKDHTTTQLSLESDPRQNQLLLELGLTVSSTLETLRKIRLSTLQAIHSRR